MVESAGGIAEGIGLAKNIGAILANGWATSGALSLLCWFLFRRAEKAQERVESLRDKLETNLRENNDVSKRVTEVMARLEHRIDAADQRTRARVERRG